MTTVSGPAGNDGDAQGTGASRSEPLFAVSGLGVDIATDHGWAHVVDNVSFEVGAGEAVGLVGESGSGKTITSLALMGLLPKATARVTGSVRLDGRELLSLRRRELEDVRGSEIGMVFQEPSASLNPAFTIGDQIAEGIRRHENVSRKQALERAITVLDSVGIAQARARVASYPHELSGGMQQRVIIAMAIACGPKLLIADEPTTALDVTIQAQILDLLRRMQDELHLGLVLISHSMGVIAEICSRALVMYAGQVIENAEIVPLFESPKHPYTEALLAAVPRLEDTTGSLASIGGSPPLPWAMPPGCRFQPRCAYALDSCSEGPVELTLAGEDHLTRCRRADELYVSRAPNG